MKLGKVTTNDPLKRVNISLHSSVIATIETYQALYRKNTGDEITTSLLIESMVKQFMADDKEFKKYQAEQVSAAKDETKADSKKVAG